MNNQAERLNTPTKPVENPEVYKAILDFEQQKQNLKTKESFGKAYLWSVLIPPIGIYYFIKYFFFGDGSYDRKKAAILSLVLTIVSLIVNIWLIQIFLNQTIGGDGQNLDILKELITSGNQKDLQELLR